jgi:SET domain
LIPRKIVLIGFPDRHVNHSCDPNAYLVYVESSCWLVARRNIAESKEITIDYSINLVNGSTWPCNCGAKRCRRVVVGDFFQLPAPLQLEYRPLLAEWFVRNQRARINRLDAASVPKSDIEQTPG